MFINRRDIDFQLYEVLHAELLCERPRFAEHDRDTFDEVIDTAYGLAADYFAPYAAACDAHEPELRDGRVNVVPQTGIALQATAEAGFFAAPFDTSVGGLRLPWVVCQACNGIFAAANVGFYGYTMLTQGAANLLLAHGSEDQIERYATPLAQGRFFGTMCLSEPQAGSSLADIRTQAVRQADGTYHLTGNKMWISGGEHELAENIVHLVLARTPDAAPGAKGISLFIVPRYRVGAQDEIGESNDVRLVGLNHKMGFRGTVNTVLAFGEQGKCVGHLVGAEQHGLSYMFHMMNESRIGVGLVATALGYAGYLHALDYARQRPQGRALAAKDPAQPPIPIVQHADVRRMLLAQKAYVEGAYSLVLYCAHLVDERRTAESEATRDTLNLLLELLTPIAKSWPSEYCLEANKLAIQVLGGYGYTRDYPVERLYRDNRLNHIHEGTYGIQGLDVLGRKVQMRDGAAFRLLLARMEDTIALTRTDDRLTEYVAELAVAITALRRTTHILTECAARQDVSLALANATLYLEAIGHIVISWRWLEQARVALQRHAQASAADRAFYDGKLAACRYFFRYELPKVGPQLRLLDRLDDTTSQLAEESL